jgi:hypothetical protein
MELSRGRWRWEPITDLVSELDAKLDATTIDLPIDHASGFHLGAKPPDPCISPTHHAICACYTDPVQVTEAQRKKIGRFPCYLESAFYTTCIARALEETCSRVVVTS